MKPKGQKKRPQQDVPLKEIVYVTALLNLIEAIVELIKKLLE